MMFYALAEFFLFLLHLMNVNSTSSRRDLSEFVGCLVVSSGDVDELEAVEFVLESV